MEMHGEVQRGEVPPYIPLHPVAILCIPLHPSLSLCIPLHPSTALCIPIHPSAIPFSLPKILSGFNQTINPRLMSDREANGGRLDGYQRAKCINMQSFAY